MVTLRPENELENSFYSHAPRTYVERVFQPVLREDAHASSQEGDPW